MSTTKQRDYMWDVFRGLCMLAVPISHFTKASANWYQDLFQAGFNHSSLAGFTYITINVFVMQAFMFISGYFSKNVDKVQKNSFKNVLWPYLVFTTITMIAGYGFNVGIGHWFSYLTPPFALWFLFCLFIYQVTLKYVIKFEWALPFSIAMMLVTGLLPFGDYLALGRMFSYYPFFLMGYYITPERIKYIQKLKTKKVVLTLLAAALLGASYWLLQTGPTLSWFLLSDPASQVGVEPLFDILYRGVVLVLAVGWIVLMLNILPNKKNHILAIIGVGTMPIYIFHLGVRHIIKFDGLYIGAIVVGLLFLGALVSWLYAEVQHKAVWALYGVVIAGGIALFASGILTPLFNLVPENKIAFYVLVYGSGTLCALSFLAPVYKKIYNFVVDGPLWATEKLKRWLAFEKESKQVA